MDNGVVVGAGLVVGLKNCDGYGLKNFDEYGELRGRRKLERKLGSLIPVGSEYIQRRAGGNTLVWYTG